MRHLPRLVPPCLGLLLCACLTACYEPPKPPVRYVNKPYLFSFIPPKGWTVTEEKTEACQVSVEARHGDCRFYVCVSVRPTEFLPTSSDFANCELVKAYVADTLKGFNISCRPTTIQGRRSYDAIYLRRVDDGAGGVKLQLVRQTFLSRGKMLYTLTSYVFGRDEAELRALAPPCDNDITRAEATFFLHQPGSFER